MIPPTSTAASLTGQFKEFYEDVQSRSRMAAELLLNTTPGMLNSMVEMGYPGQTFDHPDFGAPILEDARRLQQVR